MGNEMSRVKLFESKKIRSVWNEEEEKWYFSVVDVIEVLTESPRPRKYWNALKTKLTDEGSELSQKMGQLKMQADDGKMRLTDVADTEQLFRLIQSIPSPKAEPFKKWLVKDAQGFVENKVAAKKGGEVAGSARKDLEDKTGKKITTDENYIDVPEKVKRLKGKK